MAHFNPVDLLSYGSSGLFREAEEENKRTLSIPQIPRQNVGSASLLFHHAPSH